MSYSYASAVTGVVTQAATAATINIPVPGFGDLLKFEIWDETQFASTGANTDMVQAWWYKDMPAGSAFVHNKASGSASNVTLNMVTTGGFTLVDPTASQLQAAKTGTAITNADPAVVTSNAHGYSVGDVVLLTNTTGMLQISGMAFTITAVSTNTFTLGYLDASGFAAAATNVVSRKLNFLSPYVPRRANITNIGSASSLGVASGTGTSSIITLAETNIFTVGQAVRIYVPNSFISAGSNPFINIGTLGTSNVNSLIVTATITAINTADNSSPAISNTITVNINSVGTTFAYPTSATAATGIQRPFVEPVGEAATTSAGLVNPQNLLDDRTQNTGNYIMQLGSNVYGVASDVIRWFAWRGVVNS